MRDVAPRAGVGLATVSRVVNGAPGVTPELAEKVREAARELGYRHDATASSLRVRLRAAGHRRVAYFGDLATSWTAREGLSGLLDVFPASRIVSTNEMFEEVLLAYQDFADHDDRYV